MISISPYCSHLKKFSKIANKLSVLFKILEFLQIDENYVIANKSVNHVNISDNILSALENELEVLQVFPYPYFSERLGYYDLRDLLKAFRSLILNKAGYDILEKENYEKRRNCSSFYLHLYNTFLYPSGVLLSKLNNSEYKYIFLNK